MKSIGPNIALKNSFLPMDLLQKSQKNKKKKRFKQKSELKSEPKSPVLVIPYFLKCLSAPKILTSRENFLHKTFSEKSLTRKASIIQNRIPHLRLRRNLLSAQPSPRRDDGIEG